ncbi:hypothetical protein QR665_17260 [Acinetobacter gerneri]|uniref:hypothetical protein n=1 Tax=Acinetobacter gerneri TaxID=202952 RepID=UPI00293571E1|nr:hypothetical protein [Acinetobacter gerneri]MDV2441196.1 hypothetical protein [Acinetobacter gerneri]
MDIQNFIDEFKKTFVYDMLSQTLTDDQLFAYTEDNGQVIWFKEQMRQMWKFAKSQAVPDGLVLVPKDNLMTVLCNCSDAMENESTSSVFDKTGQPSTWYDYHVVAEKNILSAIPDAQEQTHD